MVSLEWLGAAEEVTGSKIIVDNRGEKILLDCGMNQGHKDTAYLKNKAFVDNIPKVDKVILSHSHIDHSGMLPALVKHGYTGKIYATPGTTDLCRYMLVDSAKVYLKELPIISKMLKKKKIKVPVVPFYDLKDVDVCMDRFYPVKYNQECNLSNTAKFSFHDSCHILGSASTKLVINNDGKPIKLWYTSDLGYDESLVCNEPEIPLDINNLIIESTYGDRSRKPIDVYQAILDQVLDTHRRGGKLVIPAFSVGRMQTVILILHKLYELGLIPDIKIFVDSPLGVNVTGLHSKYLWNMNEETIKFFTSRGKDPFNFGLINYITSMEDSQALAMGTEPCIIVSASGMMEGGHIREHAKQMCGDKKSTILFVGFNAEGTLGRRFEENNGLVIIDGKEYRVNCKVEKIGSLSAHADLDYLVKYVKACVSANRIENIFLIHGEPDVIKSFKETLIRNGVETNIIIPVPGEKYKL